MRILRLSLKKKKKQQRYLPVWSERGLGSLDYSSCSFKPRSHSCAFCWLKLGYVMSAKLSSLQPIDADLGHWLWYCHPCVGLWALKVGSPEIIISCMCLQVHSNIKWRIGKILSQK